MGILYSKTEIQEKIKKVKQGQHHQPIGPKDFDDLELRLLNIELVLATLQEHNPVIFPPIKRK